jgi:hypothetical protein
MGTVSHASGATESPTVDWNSTTAACATVTAVPVVCWFKIQLLSYYPPSHLHACMFVGRSLHPCHVGYQLLVCYWLQSHYVRKHENCRAMFPMGGFQSCMRKCVRTRPKQQLVRLWYCRDYQFWLHGIAIQRLTYTRLVGFELEYYILPRLLRRLIRRLLRILLLWLTQPHTCYAHVYLWLTDCPSSETLGICLAVSHTGSGVVNICDRGVYVMQHTILSSRHPTINEQKYVCTGKASSSMGGCAPGLQCGPILDTPTDAMLNASRVGDYPHGQYKIIELYSTNNT